MKILVFLDRSKPLTPGNKEEFIAGWFIRRALGLLKKSGITYGASWFRDENPSLTLRAHEYYHRLDQVREGKIPFLFNYLKEYFVNRIKYKMSHNEAYEAISYEKDARWYAKVATRLEE